MSKLIISFDYDIDSLMNVTIKNIGLFGLLPNEIIDQITNYSHVKIPLILTCKFFINDGPK